MPALSVINHWVIFFRVKRENGHLFLCQKLRASIAKKWHLKLKDTIRGSWKLGWGVRYLPWLEEKHRVFVLMVIVFWTIA